MSRIITAVLLLFYLASGVSSAAVIHVPGDQPTIQAGINAASNGDTVLVANGTYTGSGNRDLDFGGRAITVRSAGNPSVCIIDCGGSEENPHRGFYFHSGEGLDSVVMGFTIRNGWAHTGWPQNSGGGILCEEASPTISGNIITENTAEARGGGICCDDGSPLITGNTITENEITSAISGQGGGLFCSGTPTVIYNTISDNYGIMGGGGLLCVGSSMILYNTISENRCGRHGYGGGILCFSSVQITGNLIMGNEGTGYGGGIFCGVNATAAVTDNTVIGNIGGGIGSSDSSARITGNQISNNLGPGIECEGDGSPIITNNVITGNYANSGGGIRCGDDTAPLINNNTIAGNTGVYAGGGIYCRHNSNLIVTNSILWDNSAPRGKEIYIGDSYAPSTLTISFSDVQGGQSSVYIDTGCQLNWGEGMMAVNPIFAIGPLGPFYLSQTAAGQSANSPCVNAGNTNSADWDLDSRTTRTDSVVDTGVVDLGFHYGMPGPEPNTLITGGPEGDVDFRVVSFSFTGLDDADPPADLVFSYRLDDRAWSSYSSSGMATLTGLSGTHRFSVRARDRDGHVDPTPAMSIFTVTAWEDKWRWRFMVTGPGPAALNPPLVRTSHKQWLAYGVLKYGVNVACAELNGAGRDEILTGPGPAEIFGPHVRGWSSEGAAFPEVSFLAYGTHKYGVNVSAGDIDHDGFDEIITGAAPGAVFGPHIRGWDYDGDSVSPILEVNFIAYRTRKWGVNVTCGNIDGDAYNEILSGPGPGAVFGPHVRGWNYDGGPDVDPIPAVNFFAYGVRKYGVNVACTDLDENGVEEIITGPGPGSMFGAHVRIWKGSSPYLSFFAYPGTKRGVIVAGGNLDEDGPGEVLTMPGPDPAYAAHSRGWNIDAGEITPISSRTFMAYDSWMRYGGRIDVGNLP